MIVEGLKKYFEEFSGVNRVRTAFLSENPPDYAIYPEGKETVIKKYVSGDMLCQFVFSFRARMTYNKKDEETKEFCILFENLADWVKEKSDMNYFPSIGYENEMQNLEALDSGKIRNTGVSDCVYEMRFKATYYKRR